MATTTSKESRDYYANMPDWMKDQLMGDAAFEGEFRDAMSNVANAASSKPRAIAGLDPRETAAMSGATKATEALVSGNNAIMAGLNRDVRVPTSLGNIKDPTAMGDAYSAGAWRDVTGPTRDFTAIDAPSMADTDAMRAKYEDQYTGNVVDTTLAGMSREAQRAQLARDAKNAAIGGTSNSRSAVADAVAGQLSGMNMAQMEAKLRSDAFNTAAGFGLDEANMTNQFGLDSAEFRANQEELRRKYGLDVAEFDLANEQARSGYDIDRAASSLAEEEARAKNSLALAGFSLDEAMAQAAQGNTAAQLALEKAGLAGRINESSYSGRVDNAGRLAGLGETARELAQKRIDSAYYGPMEAGSWLSDVYSGSRTRDSAPYNYSSTSETESEDPDEPSKWQQFVSGAAAGLSNFL
jgi:hypothetical protein